MIYLFDKETNQLAINDDGEIITYNSSEEAAKDFEKEGWILDKIKDRYLFLRPFKLLESVDIDLGELPSNEDVEFNLLANAAMGYINNHHDPHTSIIATTTTFEVVRGVKATQSFQHVKD